MASHETSNYGLCQWEAEDPVIRSDFNQDNEKIDAALTALQAKTGGFGNCTVIHGTYAGEGSTSKSITTEGSPLALLVSGPNGAFFGVRGSSYGYYLYTGDSVRSVSISWKDGGATWSSSNVITSLNSSGKTYAYVALVANG